MSLDLLKKKISEIISLNKHDHELIETFFKPLKVEKSISIVESGKNVQNVFFINSGYIRYYKSIDSREGASNCMTTLKLKDDYTFKERNVCFGVIETNGKYHVKNDTIYFDSEKIGRDVDRIYSFGVIKPSKFNNDGNHYDFVRYKSDRDTIGYAL